MPYFKECSGHIVLHDEGGCEASQAMVGKCISYEFNFEVGSGGWDIKPGPMIGENRQLITNEPVEFEK